MSAFRARGVARRSSRARTTSGCATAFSRSSKSRPMSDELNPVEVWKAARHGFDVWPDVLRWAREATPHAAIEEPDLQRMKWHGLFWRKHDRDRYMIRIRIPACDMTADQARAIAFVAYESGHGIVDLTTRGNVQVQGLTIQKIPGVVAALDRAGLTAKQTGMATTRNAPGHRLAGAEVGQGWGRKCGTECG